MSHTAGLPSWSDPVTVETLYDWDQATSLLAAQEPWWEPGTASGYHAITQGFLEGELVRRVTGQTIGEFVAAEIAGPLGADFHIGTERRARRPCRPRDPAEPPVQRRRCGSRFDRRARGPIAAPRRRGGEHDPVAAGRAPRLRRVRQRPLGRHDPCADGVRRRSQRGATAVADGLDPVFDEQTYAQDLVLPLKLRHGIGFGLPSPDMPISPNPRACYWGGWGGSLAVIDLDARMTFAYVMNKMGESTTGDLRASDDPRRPLHRACLTFLIGVFRATSVSCRTGVHLALR